MTGPEGNSEFCFLTISLIFKGNKIHCSPRDQSLHVSDLLYSKTKQKQIVKNAVPVITSGHLQLHALITFKNSQYFVGNSELYHIIVFTPWEKIAYRLCCFPVLWTEQKVSTLVFKELEFMGYLNWMCLKVVQNSFHHFPKRRFWWVIITTLYQLTLQSWYQKSAQSFWIPWMAKIWAPLNCSMATIWHLVKLKWKICNMSQSTNTRTNITVWKWEFLEFLGSMFSVGSLKVTWNFGHFRPLERPKSWCGDMSKKKEHLPQQISWF